VRVVVTRAEKQAEELAGPLRERGVEVILLPVIGIAPPADGQALKAAAKRANEYDWIVFTSVNAIEAFAAELREPVTARIATVGAATREAAEEHGFKVSVTPAKYVAEALVEALGAEKLAGCRMLIPSAAVTRDVVPAGLRERGAQVVVVEAYRNVVPEGAAARAAEVFSEPLPDWVTFASSSAVDHLVKLVDAAILRRVKIATIGPVTSATVRKHGLNVTAEAEIHTVEGLVDALDA